MSYTTIDDPSAHFQTLTYTGNASYPRNLTNDGNSDLKPDFIWLKNRGYNGTDHVLTNSSVGFDAPNSPSAGGQMASNSSGGENVPNATYGYISAHLTDGFTAQTGGTNGDTVNWNTYEFVAWQWKAAGGTTASNSDGSITSTVQANTTAGFSIITYTGTGGAETFGHGLGVAPDMWIIKRRNGTGSWAVGFNDSNILGGTSKYLILQGSGATSTYSNFWGTSPASSTVMRIAGDATIGGSSNTYVAYAWAQKQGYSKFGTYTGNGNANGTFVYTGFKPACVITKETSGSGGNWRIFDNKRAGYNDDNYRLTPNENSAESTSTHLDLYSNGFKFRNTGTSYNGSGDSYIYMAWAENPFVTSTGIPTTAR